MQLFFANVDADKFPETTGPVSCLLNFFRYIVPWLVAIFAVSAFVKSLRVWGILRCFRWTSQMRSAELVLVVGLSEKGLAIIAGERQRDPRVSIVAMDLDPNNPAVAAAESLDAIVWIGDAQSKRDLQLCCWRRPNRVFAVTGSDRVNVIVLDEIRKLYQDVSHEGTKTDVYAHISNPNDLRQAAELAILNSDTESLLTHLFNFDEDAATYLLHKHPVLPDQSMPPRVLIIGIGPLGYAVFRELLRQVHFMPQDLQPGDAIDFPEIVTVDVDARRKDEITQSMPFLLTDPPDGISPFVKWSHYTGNVQDWSYDDYLLQRGEKGFSNVFLFMGSEIRNLSTARKIAAWEQLARSGKSSAFKRPCDVTGIAYEASTGSWLDEREAGGVITAKVVRIDQKFVVVNAGHKSESMIPVEDFHNERGELKTKQDEDVLVAIEMLEDGYGATLLSREKAKKKIERATKKVKLADKLNVRVFSLDEVYSKEAMHWRENIERLAIAINDCYDEIFREPSVVLNKTQDHLVELKQLTGIEGVWYVGSMQSSKINDSKWVEKNEYERQSSLDQARHFNIKLHQLGFEWSPQTSPPTEVEWKTTKDSLDKKLCANLDLLAESEHRRWNAALLLRKFVLLAEPPRNASDQERKEYNLLCKPASVHKSLVAFEALDALDALGKLDPSGAPENSTKGYDYALMYNLIKVIELAKMRVKPLP
jgi:Trk K+ transport system NAD-binding subunit